MRFKIGDVVAIRRNVKQEDFGLGRYGAFGFYQKQFDEPTDIFKETFQVMGFSPDSGQPELRPTNRSTYSRDDFQQVMHENELKMIWEL